MKMLIGAIALLFSINSNADFVQIDWRSAGDKAIVRDTDTGLEWLHLSYAKNKTVNDLMGQWFGNTDIFPLTGAFSEFRYASSVEVTQLYKNFGVDVNVTAAGVESWIGVNIAFQALGTTASKDNITWQTALVVDSPGVSYAHGIKTDSPRKLVYSQFNPDRPIDFDTKDTTLGSFLVRVASTTTATVKFSEYFYNGSDGDTWTYVKPDNSQFTYTYESINTGANTGRIKVGNANSGIIYESSGGFVTWHEVIGEAILIPPFIFPADITLDQETGLELVVLWLPSLTVQAGTFNDVIVFAWLDKNFPANTMNTTLDLNAITASAVTDVDWYARGVGLIKIFGVDAATGNNDGTEYELFSHSVAQSVNNPSTNDGGGGGGMLNIHLLFVLLPLLIFARIRRKA